MNTADDTDRSDWLPLDEDEHAAQLAGLDRLLRNEFQHTPKLRVLDLGAGDGRIATHLLARGAHVTAIERDPAALDALERLAEETREAERDAELRVVRGDFLQLDELIDDAAPPVDLTLCLGNTLTLLHDPLDALALFNAVQRRIVPEGIFLLDDLPALWNDVAEGNWQAGVSSDDPDDADRMQLVWADGDPVVAFRTADRINTEEDQLGPDDRPLRLYSLGELRLLAHAAGFQPPQRLPDRCLLTLRRAPRDAAPSR